MAFSIRVDTPPYSGALAVDFSGAAVPRCTINPARPGRFEAGNAHGIPEGIAPGKINLEVDVTLDATFPNGPPPPNRVARWRDVPKFQIGLCQKILANLERTTYRSVARPKGIVYEKQTIRIGSEVRDAGTGAGAAAPWYDGRLGADYVEFWPTRLGDFPLNAKTLSISDAPGVSTPEITVMGVQQQARFETSLVLLLADPTRSWGVVLYRWHWTADFRYLRVPTRGGRPAPAPLAYGGIVLIQSEDLTAAPASIALPNDEPVGLRLLASQASATAWQELQGTNPALEMRLPGAQQLW